MVFQSLLNNSFNIYRKTSTSDGQGGWNESLVLLGSTEGRIRPANSNERVTAQGEEQKITHVLYVKGYVDISKGDVIVCGDLQVRILGVRDPSYAHEHLEIDAYEIQKEDIQ